VAEAGREHGRHAGAVRAADGQACLEAITGELAEMGFDPATATDGAVTTVAFTNCPFRELAEAFPELVCHLHRGMIEGMAEVLRGVDVERFATLADRDPCQVDLAVR
jgi:predicted ArsR family transcriptional regulator